MSLNRYLLVFLKLLPVLFFFIMSSAQSQSVEKIENILDRKKMSAMLDILQKSGKISKEQAAKAKKELNSYSDEELSLIKKKAISKLKQGTFKIPNMNDSKKIDIKNEIDKNKKNTNKNKAKVKVKTEENKTQNKKTISSQEALEYLNK